MCFSKLFKHALLAALVAGLVAACGGGGGGGGTTPPPTPTSNVLPVTVDSGPLDETGQSVNAANSLYTTVTVCQHGSSTNCQTIDHVLVDTGSTGLRLLSSQLPSSLNLPLAGSAGAPVLNCVQFVDQSFMWGPVATADVVLAGTTASNVPIQVVGDPKYNPLSAACQTGTGGLNTIATLGAKGILGVGLFLQDCGNACAAPVNSSNYVSGVYFTCATAACSATTNLAVSTASQVQNPVSMFTANNNGLVVSLPAVASSTTSISGSIIFGVATQSNNRLSSGGHVLPTDGYGNITTAVLQGASTNNSYIDSGSNALYFNSNAIPTCAANSAAAGFYCPSVLTLFTALMSVTPPTPTPASVTVQFYVDNAVTLFSNPSWSVFPTLAAPNGPASGGLAAALDWGLPFFFGKNVFIGFEGRSSSLGSGTYFAF